MLGVIIGLLVVRGTLFVLGWVLGFDFWLFPRLFDESLGFVEPFTPVWKFPDFLVVLLPWAC